MRSRPHPGLARLGLWVLAVVIGGGVLSAGVLLLGEQTRAFFTAGTVGSGDLERLRFGDLNIRSVVKAKDGSVLKVVHAEENRVAVPLDRVPDHVVEAVLVAEDERFFSHGALDLQALARAVKVNLSGGAVLEGGSTITQQLVKTELLTSRQDLSRKTREAALAIRIEARMSKAQILERYLNAVYFGNGAYGLQAASERYFNTDVERITRGQAILLAGLIRNPVGADPFGSPLAARQRRDAIVDRMVELGRIESQEAVALKDEPLPARPGPVAARGADYFLDEVTEQLLADPLLGDTEADRYRAVFKGGLTIETTLDLAAQGAAEKAVADIFPNSEGRFNVALASVEPATGAVRALVGGPDFERSRFNLATDGDGRQVGSAFKPFTLLAAIEAGYYPDDVVLGTEPCPIANPDGEPNPWTPGNVEGQSAGVLSLTDATVQSVNCAYARLVKVVGPEKVVAVASRLGITNPLAPHLSITLGSQGVTALAMAGAYATLAADGVRRTPYFIERVIDRNGNVLIEGRPVEARVVSAQNARIVTQVLSQVVQRGTGRAAALRGWPVAGKTGSTDNNADAWFVGYTPALSTAVWMGSPVGRVPMVNVGGLPRVYGGTFPARIWGAYTGAALVGQSPQTFLAPDALPAHNRRFLDPAGQLDLGPDFDATDSQDKDQLPDILDPDSKDLLGGPNGPGLSIPDEPSDSKPKTKKKKAGDDVGD